MRGLKCLKAGGAFYAFPDAREAIQNLYAAGKITAATDMALSEYLLEQVGVALHHLSDRQGRECFQLDPKMFLSLAGGVTTYDAYLHACLP
mgnify:CR=1 FL=1